MKAYWDEIQRIAKAHHLEDPTASNENFSRFLKWWWCRTFNRPMKDPILETYTLHELCYEFLRYYYLNPDNDPRKELEAKKVKEADDEWIRQEMAKISGSKAATKADLANAEIKTPSLPVVAPQGSVPDRSGEQASPDLSKLQDSLDTLAKFPNISTRFED